MSLFSISGIQKETKRRIGRGPGSGRGKLVDAVPKDKNRERVIIYQTVLKADRLL